MTTTPRLTEPVYRLQIQCPGEIVDATQLVLTRRRGHVVQDRPLLGSTLYSVMVFLPVLDIFWLETELRAFSQGQAIVTRCLITWQ